MAVTRSTHALSMHRLRSKRVPCCVPERQPSLLSARLRTRRTAGGASPPADQIHPDIEIPDNQVPNNPVEPPSDVIRESHPTGDVDQSSAMETDADSNCISDLNKLAPQNASGSSDSQKSCEAELQCACSSFIGAPVHGL